MIIDGHAHVGAWKEPTFSGRATTLRDADHDFEASGVQAALLMPTDEADNAGLLDAITACPDNHPVTYRFCAWVDPRDEHNRPWIEANSSRIAALKIHPSFLRIRPTDSTLSSTYELAGRHGWPVLIHCGRWQEMSSWKFGVEVAENHPQTNIILCHMGGDSTDLIEATVDALSGRGPSNAYLGTESIRQYWIVRHAVDQLGAARIIFGSDYNLNVPAAFVAVVDALRLSDEDRSAVLGGNLNGLLGASQRF
jgi:predicted TIM-barrel fold metal-dependent hydrolase